LAQMFGCLARVRMDSGNNEMVCVVAWNGANLFQEVSELQARLLQHQKFAAQGPFADASGLSPTCAGMRGYTWAAQDHTVEWKRHKLLEMRLRKRLWSIVEVTCREIFARELQKACGGISFGNPIRLHIFRLQRDKGRRRGLESGRRDKGGSS
ncbi:hypothetical protein Tco_1048865, partial [Tanacetum coccineum]